MKIWIGYYSTLSSHRYNQYVFTDKTKADEWWLQAKLMDDTDTDDIGNYSLIEVETDDWDGKPAVPFYEAHISIDVEMPQHERSKVLYYKRFKWPIDEREDYHFDNGNLNWAKKHMLEQGMNHMHTIAYGHTKEELISLVEQTFEELGMRPQTVVFSKNWDA